MRGWLAITMFVVGYDLWAGTTGRPTLSTTFRETAQDHRTLTLVGSAYMIAHLHGFIPSEHDPLGMVGRAYGRMVHSTPRRDSNPQPTR